MALVADWLSFRRFAAATTGITLALITLGVYTAATGSGLACNAEWPLCSGQLVPALTINPDFIEWFHRVVAMFAGLQIIALAAWAWLGGKPRRSRLASTLAVVLLPLQISIGAVTVTIGGLIPGGYAMPTHAVHLLAALAIYLLLIVTTLWAYEGRYRRPPGSRVRLALFGAIAGVAVSLPFSRAIPLLAYDPGGQAWYFVGSLFAFAALVAAIVWTDVRLLRGLASIALAGLFVTMLLGRDIVIYGATVRILNVVLLAIVVVSLLVAIALSTRDRGSDRDRRTALS